MVGKAGPDGRGGRKAKMVEVLDGGKGALVVGLLREQGVDFVVAENRRISHEFLVPEGAALNAKPGQVVMAQIVEQPSKHAQPVARVIEVLGNYADPGMEIEIALRKHELPHVFARDVTRACEKFSE